MGRIIKLSISSRAAETDAPSVDDLLDQVRDYFDIVRGVEEAIAGDGSNVVDWRVVDAGKNSPIALAVEAFPRIYGVNIDQRAELAVRHAAAGMQALQTGEERPPYFTEKVLGKAGRFFARVTNGLDLTRVDHGAGVPELVVTPATARAAARHTESILKPPAAKPYRELGSLEGYFQSVERDGWGRPILFVRHRLTGEPVKCLISEEARETVEQHRFADIWSSRRVEVFGTISYKSLGKIAQVEAVAVRFLRPRSELPKLEDIEDENFTGGLRSEDYIARLRDGELT